MPPRFQRFLRTEGILGKVRCHTEKGTHHGPRTGWVYYLLFIFLFIFFFFNRAHIHINLANKQTKQNSEKEEERKKEKETETKRAENVIFKGTAH